MDEAIKREFDQSNKRLDALEGRMGELAENSAIIATQMKEMVEQRKELRSELQQWRSDLAPVVLWVQAQMVPGGILSRMEKVEQASEKDREITKAQFAVVHKDLRDIRDLIQWVKTYGAAIATIVLFLYGIFGDALKKWFLGGKA
jgi:regulator of replication initiation timing